MQLPQRYADGMIDGLVGRVEAIVRRRPDRRTLVGVAGAPGAGKTELTRAVVAALAGRPDWRGSRVAMVPMDGFHLADAELERLGLREVKGAPETFDAAGYAALLARIRRGESVWAPDFDRSLEQPVGQSLPVGPATRIVLSEGNYLLLDEQPWPQARACFDEVWFVRPDDAVRRQRLISRHVEFGKSPAEATAWVERSDDLNARLVARYADRADHVVDL